MKRLFRIFELSTNEQRVVLIVIFVLLAVAFVGYERRVQHSSVQTSAMDPRSTPTPVQTENEQ
jgi:hypothetical protein